MIQHGAPSMDIEEAIQASHEPLGEGNSFSIATPEHPLKRSLHVSIRASLGELCLQQARGTWAPSQEALRNIFQQRKFTALDGSAETMGDLKSIVLHDLKMTHVKSTFPISLGARITGVDNSTFSSTGESFSTIITPHTASNREKCLQSDDVSLAYQFADKFPGYTSTNLSVKGVHEVSQRRFVLVSADHPIVSAISENADQLQMGEISMMPEGLVKISQQLYDSILPVVRTQVASQLKVRDFSKCCVSIAPSEYSSWSDARAELMVEAKRPLKAQLHAEISAAAGGESEAIRLKYDAKEKQVEAEIDHRPMDLHCELEVQYNFLSK